MSTLQEGYYSLGRDLNKVAEPSTTEYPLLPELELSMDDDELISLKKDWIKQWEPYAKEIEKKQKDNELYWLGKHFTVSQEKRPLVDNLIFESLETFLPIATRPKADPVVESNNTELGNAIADKVRKMLIYITDILAFNLKMKQVARYWALYMLGCMKVGWSVKENDITCVAIRPQKLILDPKATIDGCEYLGEYIGEIMEDTASNMILRFPKKENLITEKVLGKMGTKIEYYLWSTDEYVFWTMGDEVLDKKKNPHWNYDEKVPAKESVDEFGAPMTKPEQLVPGRNHFKQPKKPYVFLSIFNIGLHPHDDTNLIQQNLPLQDLINKRLSQIDKNADNTNGGLAVSGDAFTEKQANEAANARRKGGAIWVPTGPVGDAVVDLSGKPLPSFVYESLLDYRNELRNIFGTRGSTPQGTQNEQTVRGKLITKGQDADRVGGGVSIYLEQFADSIFNWFVQLMYVYYDEPHVATVLGRERAKEYIELSNQDLTVKLLVGVKDGSMIPHDPMQKRNEAVELWGAGALDPITLFDRLEFPNPRESAKLLFQWKADPIALFPDLQAQQQQQAQAQQQQAAMQQQAQAQQQAGQKEQEGEKQRQHEMDKTKLQTLARFQ